MYTASEKNSDRYHHGNVKESLIDAALEMIETDDIERISLRRLAKEIGVTPAAVYNHFADKNALMLAIKIRLYEGINSFFDRRASNSDNPEHALLEMCLSYYHFSQLFPSRFRFLFGSTLPLQWSRQELAEVSCRSIVRARQLVLGIYEKYRIPCSEEASINTTLLLWSQLHGLISLKQSGSLKAAVIMQGWPADCALDRDQEVERLIATHVDMTVNTILNNPSRDSSH